MSNESQNENDYLAPPPLESKVCEDTSKPLQELSFYVNMEMDYVNQELLKEIAGEGIPGQVMSFHSDKFELTDESFYDIFRERCNSIPAGCIRFIDMLGTIKAKDYEGVLPGVIDINTADKMVLARFVDLCYRLQHIFEGLAEVFCSNKDAALKQIGRILKDNDEGDFVLTDMDGCERARFKRSTAFFATMVDEMKAFGWLMFNGYGSNIKQTIHYKTLNSIIETVLKDGGALPPQEVIKTQSDPTAKLTKTYDLPDVWEDNFGKEEQVIAEPVIEKPSVDLDTDMMDLSPKE